MAESLAYGDIARGMGPRLASQIYQLTSRLGEPARECEKNIKKFGFRYEDQNSWAFSEGVKTSDIIRMFVFVDQLNRTQKA